MIYKIFLLSSLFYFHCSNSQTVYSSFERFSDEFELIPLPIVIDEITLKNFDVKNNQINYTDIKKYIIDEEEIPFISVNDTIFNKFYTYGKIILDDKKGLLFSHVTNQKKSIYISIFNAKNELIWFSTLGSLGKNVNDEKYATIILPNFLFLKIRDINWKNDLTVEVFETNENILFSNYLCDEYIECSNYTPSIQSIPISQNLNLKFDNTFLLNLKLLIPLQFCSPFKNSQVLSSIDKENKKHFSSYFIGSKIIENDNRIIFFFNLYEYENYHNVMEIGFQILNKEGKLIKVDSFCEYAEDNNKNIVINKTGEIKDLVDKIQILSYERGHEDLIEFKKK